MTWSSNFDVSWRDDRVVADGLADGELLGVDADDLDAGAVDDLGLEPRPDLVVVVDLTPRSASACRTVSPVVMALLEPSGCRPCSLTFFGVLIASTMPSRLMDDDRLADSSLPGAMRWPSDSSASSTLVAVVQ